MLLSSHIVIVMRAYDLILTIIHHCIGDFMITSNSGVIRLMAKMEKILLEDTCKVQPFVFEAS